MQNTWKMTETLEHRYSSDTIQREIMNTNMTGFRWFSTSLRPCALDKSSLSIGRVKEILGILSSSMKGGRPTTCRCLWFWWVPPMGYTVRTSEIEIDWSRDWNDWPCMWLLRTLISFDRFCLSLCYVDLICKFGHTECVFSWPKSR